jgi:hypothetical protein
MLHAWTCSTRLLSEASRSRNVRLRGQWVWSWRRGDDARFPCYLSEREALSWMADRLRRAAVFE